jgi:hypothetical protein
MDSAMSRYTVGVCIGLVVMAALPAPAQSRAERQNISEVRMLQE